MFGRNTKPVKQYATPRLFFVFVLISGALSILCAPLEAQVRERSNRPNIDHYKPIELEGFQKDVARVHTALRDVYLQYYPTLRRLRQRVRNGSSSESEISRRKETLKSELHSEFERIERQISSLDPSRKEERREKEAAEWIFQLFRNLVQKMIEGQTAKERREARRFSKRERIDRGLARASLIRRKFLTELMGKLRHFDRGMIGGNLRLYTYRLTTLYWKVVPAYLERRMKIREARIIEEENESSGEKEKNGESKEERTTESKQGGVPPEEASREASAEEKRTVSNGSKSDQSSKQGDQDAEKDSDEEKKIKKRPFSHPEVQTVVKEVRSSWSDFWTKIAEEWEEMGTKLDQYLLLFRGRKHLPRTQSYHKSRSISLKRQYAGMKRFRQEGIFTDPVKRRKMLLLMVKLHLKRTIIVLRNDARHVLRLFRKVREFLSDVIDVEDKEEFQKKKKEFQQRAKKLISRLGSVKDLYRNLNSIKPKYLKKIATLLRENHQEKQVAEEVTLIADYTTSLKAFADRLKTFSDEFTSFIEEHEFKKKKSFKEKVKTKFLTGDKNLKKQLRKNYNQFDRIDVLSEKFLEKNIEMETNGQE